MNRKQEVIDKIERFLFAAWEAGSVDGRGGYSQHCSPEEAKILYDRIAPLREFPEAGTKNCLRDLAYDLKNDKVAFGPRLGGEPAISYYLNKLQRLWEGGDHIAEVRKKVREFPDQALKDLLKDADLWTKEGLFQQIKNLFEGQHPPSIHDLEGVLWVLAIATTDSVHVQFPPAVDATRQGTCSKCGGIGEIDHITPRGDEELGIDCPDCDGTGECQHKGETHRQWGKRPYCYVCNSYFDERSGKERRDWGVMPRRVPSPGHREYDYLRIKGGRIEDRRDGKDRRASQS